MGFLWNRLVEQASCGTSINVFEFCENIDCLHPIFKAHYSIEKVGLTIRQILFPVVVHTPVFVLTKTPPPPRPTLVGLFFKQIFVALIQAY